MHPRYGLAPFEALLIDVQASSEEGGTFQLPRVVQNAQRLNARPPGELIGVWVGDQVEQRFAIAIPDGGQELRQVFRDAVPDQFIQLGQPRQLHHGPIRRRFAELCEQVHRVVVQHFPWSHLTRPHPLRGGSDDFDEDGRDLFLSCDGRFDGLPGKRPRKDFKWFQIIGKIGHKF